jgi:hypothetical protein
LHPQSFDFPEDPYSKSLWVSHGARIGREINDRNRGTAYHRRQNGQIA